MRLSQSRGLSQTAGGIWPKDPRTRRVLARMPAGRRVRPALVWLRAWLHLTRPAATLIHGPLEPVELIQLAGMLRDAGARRVRHLCARHDPADDDLATLSQAGLDWLVRQDREWVTPKHPIDLLILTGPAPSAEFLAALSFTDEALVVGFDTGHLRLDGCLDGPGGQTDPDFELVLAAPDGLDLWLARRRGRGERVGRV